MRKYVIFKKKLLDDVHPVLQCEATMAKHALLCDMMLWGRKSLVASSLALGDSSRVDGQLNVCAGEMAATSTALSFKMVYFVVLNNVEEINNEINRKHENVRVI